jgi:hypothetical protein
MDTLTRKTEGSIWPSDAERVEGTVEPLTILYHIIGRRSGPKPVTRE